LQNISKVGCSKFSANGLMKDVMSKLKSAESNKGSTDKNKSENNGINLDEEGKKLDELFNPDLPAMCNEKADTKCCDPDNFVLIADVLTTLINNPIASALVKEAKMYPSFILFTQALYEKAVAEIVGPDDFVSKPLDEKKMYLRRFKENKINKLTGNDKETITKFINSRDLEEFTPNFNDQVLGIKKILESVLPKYNDNFVKDVTGKINNLEELIIQFASEDDSSYIKGKSLIKNLFKIIFVDIFCNIMNTTNSSLSVISQLGEIKEVSDMIKSGVTAGVFVGIMYFFTVLVLIIMGIFNMF
jgi:hypothetical protein